MQGAACQPSRGPHRFSWQGNTLPKEPAAQRRLCELQQGFMNSNGAQSPDAETIPRRLLGPMTA
eukprot:5608297-Alexandrium_andersonii.AAC.2